MQWYGVVVRMLLVASALLACVGLALADAAPPSNAALDYINAGSPDSSAGVNCRFIFEYTWSDQGPGGGGAGTVSRAIIYSGALFDGRLGFSSDRHSISGLGLAFAFDLMNDTGHGRMARESGSSNVEAAIRLGNVAPTGFTIADVTPQDRSVSLDWLRAVLPPESFSALDRVAGEYRANGWNSGRNAGACALGAARIIEVRWSNLDGSPGKSDILWSGDPAGLARALGKILQSAGKS